MSSCYQYCKVLLTKFYVPKNFKNCLQIKMQFFRISSKKKSSEASSSSGSIRRSYVEPSASSIRDATIKSCLWPCEDFMVSAPIKEEFEQYVHNAELGPYIEDKCIQHLSLTESFTKEFKFHPRESRVCLNFMTVHLPCL
jgi:hypothetical protein